MSSEGGLLDAFSLDSVFPCGLTTIDTNVPESNHVVNLCPSSNSLEPPTELDLQLPEACSDEMDENFLAALQLLDESFDVGDLSGSELSLQATAFMIQSVESPNTSVSDPEEASASLTNDPTSLKNIDTPNPRPRHRVSTKQQINNLRGTIKELTEQLDSVRSGPTQAESAGNETLLTGVGSNDPVWQQIAARQLERRREAERDNAKLRAMLDLQVLEAKNLKRVLKRRTRIEMMEDMLGVKRHKMLADETKADDSCVLQEMLQSTDEIYAGMDNEFANKGMDQVPCPGKTRTANRHATNGVMLEIMEKQIVPFETKMTEKAVASALGQIAMQPLQCVKDVNAQVDFYAQNSQQSDDTMMISYTAGTTDFKCTGMQFVRIRKVMRKYVEEDQAVFICRIISQPQFASQKKGVELRCVIRVVVQADQGNTALIKSYYSVSRHVPVKEEFRSHNDVDLAIAAWDESIARVSGELESFLLDAKITSSTMTTRRIGSNAGYS